MENHKWVDGIDHDYFAYPETRSYESEMFGESANVITIKDGCHDYDHADKENLEHEFLIAVEQNGLSDCIYKEFLYRRFNHDEVTYDYE
jgi:hypothetical protein